MNRKVKYLRTHSEIFMGAAIGSVGSTLPKGTELKLDMLATEIGVIVEASREASIGRPAGKATALIPYGNIQLALLEDEEPSKEAFKKR